MTDLYIVDNALAGTEYRARCDNCSAVHSSRALAKIADAEQRLTPGGEVPAGECPDCGCLAYLVKETGSES